MFLAVIRYWLIGSLVLVWAKESLGQTRIVQWSDAHSTIDSISKQTYAIDQAGQEFLRAHPRGEFIVYVLGDHTSINPYNALEGGWLFLEAIRLLRSRGYTVLFTPGNHDAFDWTARIRGEVLFLEQVQQLHQWGVRILVTNLREKTPEFRALTSRSYRLERSRGSTEIVGLTIPQIMSKSNLTDTSASRLFGRIESFQETWERVLPNLDRRGVERVIFGVHSGHSALAKQTKMISATLANHNLSIRVPLLMGAHDHLAASYSKRGIHIADGASHGSFNIIDITEKGRVKTSEIRHIALTEAKAGEVQHELFQRGHVEVNRTQLSYIENARWLNGYHQRISSHMATVETELSRRLAFLQFGIPEHKQDLKRGPSLLGSLVAESLVRWSSSLIPINSPYEVVAMTNSSSYRLEEGLRPGAVTELQMRQIYPFLTESTLYQVEGSTLRSLYFSLRSFYANGDKGLHSPQLNLDVQEREGELEIRRGNQWHPIDLNARYWLVLDGWLSDHRFGQSYRVPEWINSLGQTRPFATESFQEILVRHLPELLVEHEHRLTEFNRAFCSRVFL